MEKAQEKSNVPRKNEKVPKKPVYKYAKEYLIAYNFIQTIGWSYLLLQIICFYLFPNKQKTLYDVVEWPLIIFQNAAVLEIFHALFKLVSSNAVITALQVASRVIVVCGAFIPTTAGHESIGLLLALLAWSITEIIRYGNYFLNLINALPYIVVWLRYTTFIILYPIGVTGELLCLYAAQEEVGETGVFSFQMPNWLNFAFNYQKFLIFIIILYIPLFPQMYLHMFAQRQKVLGGKSKRDT